jgi:repressor LexA
MLSIIQVGSSGTNGRLGDGGLRMKELTPRQREILEFVRAFSDRHGVPPAVREIGQRFGFTARAAFDHLKALERKGMLERRVTDRRASRTLVLPGHRSGRRPPREAIPVLGRIAAGTPILAVENREDSIPLTPDWFGAQGEDVFALRVRGDSMVQAHIVEGDLVLVRKQEAANPGDIVAALLDGEATVKRFARDGRAVVLKPEHPTMKPIVVDPARRDFHILGKVIGVLRSL